MAGEYSLRTLSGSPILAIGFEPIIRCSEQILSLPCLPFSPSELVFAECGAGWGKRVALPR